MGFGLLSLPPLRCLFRMLVVAFIFLMAAELAVVASRYVPFLVLLLIRFRQVCGSSLLLPFTLRNFFIAKLSHSLINSYIH